MAKNQLLDAYHKTFALIVLVLFLSSCSMPRIIVLKDPLTPEEHINLGLSYESRGEYSPALEQYHLALKKTPIAFLYIGNLYFQKREYEKAEAAYNNAIKKTGDPRAYNNLAWLYYTTDREIKKAEELAEKAVSLSPESEEFKDTLHKILEKGGRASP
jgi:tetratricopeptide (TPR) repeat protein